MWKKKICTSQYKPEKLLSLFDEITRSVWLLYHLTAGLKTAKFFY